MTRRDAPSVISADGLRYKHRQAGESPFGGTQAFPTTSCFKCGVHKLPTAGSYRRIIGQSVFVCHDCQAKAASKAASKQAARR